jgi:hypothetical protein
MKRLSSLVAASFLVVTATAVAAPLPGAQPQCDDHDKKGDTKDDKKNDKDKKDAKGGDTKPKPPAFY